MSHEPHRDMANRQAVGFVLKGTLKRWNDEKGYGFLRQENGGPDVFIHISALRALSRRPCEGDVVFYQIAAGKDGKPRAAHAVIEGMAPPVRETAREWRLEPIEGRSGKRRDRPAEVRSKPHNPSPGYRTQAPSDLLSRFVFGIGSMAVFVLVFGIGAYYAYHFDSGPAAAVPQVQTVPAISKPPDFQCEGKTRCPQMISCEEAVFYLRHCPNTAIDGDGDGIPCEDQLCGH